MIRKVLLVFSVLIFTPLFSTIVFFIGFFDRKKNISGYFCRLWSKTILYLSNIKCNVTAVFTIDQVKEIYNAIDTNTETIISIFAGRIADSGLDPLKTMKKSLQICKNKKNIELLWASTRELYNIIQAKEINCHIITVPHPILLKLSGIGKDLKELSLDTVKSFLIDAKKSGFKI